MVMVIKEEMRKGPWTEEEDVQLMCFVGLFGERRWDFIAKVSGLQRTGKSCRLRWVNYLNPDLKRGRMSPQEERLVLELHARWGNRWSRIARKLPGRTDNEIKNYWRTHMRKKAQEMKKAAAAAAAAAAQSTLSSSSSSSSLSTSSAFSPSTTNPPTPLEYMQHELHSEQKPLAPRQSEAADAPMMMTTANPEGISVIFKSQLEEEVKAYPMEQIWEEIASSSSSDHYQNHRVPPPSAPIWDCSCCTSDPVWKETGTAMVTQDALPLINNTVFMPTTSSCFFQATNTYEWKTLLD